MDRYQKLVDATRVDYAEHILNNPLIQQLASGRVTRDHYAHYLAETFHLVRHTSRALALAAAHLGDERRGLRGWFLEQANEEHGHELFCLKDLRNLGLDPQQVIRHGPGPGAWSLFTQNYYMASHGNPAGMLGVASATEGMGAELAGGLAQVLMDQYGLPAEALTFLRSHAGFDQAHLDQARRAINEQTGDEDYDDILRARRLTFRYYGQLFRDVAACTRQYFGVLEHAA
jgi:pyrroloquinoline quinone (PQQ) biosynthesis protein C